MASQCKPATGSVFNVISAASVVVLITVLGFKTVTPKGSLVQRAEGDEEVPLIGTSLNIPDWDFATAKKTVVVATSTGCVWSREFIDFFEELTSLSKRYQVVTVFTEPLSEALRVLKDMKVDAPAVRRLDLEELHIKAFPTLLLADDTGRLQAAWPGATLAQMANLLEVLGLPQSPADARAAAFVTAEQTGRHFVSSRELSEMWSSGPIPLVDVRTSLEFEKAHFANSISMPFDELETRAINELPRSGTVISVCGSCPACENGHEEQRLRSLCVTAFQAFVMMGFEDVRMLMADPAGTEDLNIAVVRPSLSSSYVQR
jgi:hypothetical protein